MSWQHRPRPHVLSRLYRPPRCRVGGWLRDVLRGKVKVCAISDAPLQWPMTRHQHGGGKPFLIVTKELAQAVRTESELAVCYWWGVTAQTVWAWRKRLGVGPVTPGASELRRVRGQQTFTHEKARKLLAASKRHGRNAKVAAARRGKPRPKAIEAMRQANLGRSLSAETRRRMSETHRRRGTRPPAAGRPWTREEESLLGTRYL